MGILADGFNTTIVFPGAGITFIEKEVTPPALDGGGEINITGMRNVYWRTKSPKYLVTLGNISLKVRYDPQAYRAGNIRLQINLNQSLTLNFPTIFGPGGGGNFGPAVTLTFWGWMNKFAPEANKEGDEPLADSEIIPSMQNQGVEVALVSNPA